MTLMLAGTVRGLKKGLNEDTLFFRFQRLLTAFWKHEMRYGFSGMFIHYTEVKAKA